MNSRDSKSFFQFTEPILEESVLLPNNKYDSKLNNDQKIKLRLVGKKGQIDKDQKFNKINIAEQVTNFPIHQSEFNDNDTTPYFINVVMQSTFYWKKKINRKMMDNLIKVNSQMLLLSYIRPYVTNLTSKTKFKTQYIPFINFENK